eukprot:TRINITY_DN67805_c6_g3_i1.p1 TRINITY_DN67805_c6_g3~~TRINITY_DN67805_c6_g3_i1.p1  ORF type:complete len:414 (-),score=25.71 TRINITY_DN67805_c6_g3_i1:276-1517(-)
MMRQPPPRAGHHAVRIPGYSKGTPTKLKPAEPPPPEIQWLRELHEDARLPVVAVVYLALLLITIMCLITYDFSFKLAAFGVLLLVWASIAYQSLESCCWSTVSAVLITVFCMISFGLLYNNVEVVVEDPIIGNLTHIPTTFSKHCYEGAERSSVVVFIMSSSHTADHRATMLGHSWLQTAAKMGVQVVLFTDDPKDVKQIQEKVGAAASVVALGKQYNAKPTYGNHRKLWAALQHVRFNYPQAQYYLRIDDDSFLNLPYFMCFLSELNTHIETKMLNNTRQEPVPTQVNLAGKPIQDQPKQYQVVLAVGSCDFKLTTCNGGGGLLLTGLTVDLLLGWKETCRPSSIEHVTLSHCLVLNGGKGVLQHHQGFSRPSSELKGLEWISMHPLPPSRVLAVHRQLKGAYNSTHPWVKW